VRGEVRQLVGRDVGWEILFLGMVLVGTLLGAV
jgi:hypothetical protein